MPEFPEFNQGSTEHIIVDISDRLATLTDLSIHSTYFSIRKQYDIGNWEMSNVSATTVGMTVFCLVDFSILDPGIYELFVGFSDIPEQPLLGPMKFMVNA